MCDDPVHAVHVEHQLSESSEDVILMVLIGGSAQSDHAIESLILHKFVYQILIILKRNTRSNGHEPRRLAEMDI